MGKIPKKSKYKLGIEPKKKSKASLKVYYSKLMIADNLGEDVDELKVMNNDDLNLLYKNIYGKELIKYDSKGNKDYSTINAYKRVWNQISTNYNDNIKLLEKYRENTTDEKYIKKIDERIELSKKYDIDERQRTIDYTIDEFKNRGLGKELRKLVKNRLWLRVNRSKMSNQIFEDIVNGLIENYHLDRRIALEHARLIAKLPKDELAQMKDEGFITPTGIKIPKNEINFYQKNTPTVLSY